MRNLTLFVFALLLTGCDSGFKTLGSSEHGVVFSGLPVFAGGGVNKTIYGPQQKVFLFPWETLYSYNTGLQSISWGGKEEGDAKLHEDYVQTRAIDGNEVSLNMTVSYRIVPEKVGYVLQYVASNDAEVTRLVTAVARSDIRTWMNYLRTDDFSNLEERQKRVDQVKRALNERLLPEGISIEGVYYEKNLFYRERSDKTIDTSYQDQINETERTKQRVEQERFRLKTVEEEMKRKYADSEGEFYRAKEKADGELRQATERGNAKFSSLKKDAERISAVGNNEITALSKELDAYRGRGGVMLLRKEIGKALIEQDPKVVVVSQGKGGGGAGVDVTKTDTNELLQQLGILTGMESKPTSKPNKP